MYVFDTTPMWIAILLFNIIHPGQYMPGKQSDLPSSKEKRRQKKAVRAQKEGDQTIPINMQTGTEDSHAHSASKIETV